MRFFLPFNLFLFFCLHGAAQQNLAFGLINSNLSHLNPAAAGIDSALFANITFVEKPNTDLSQSLVVEYFNRNREGGFMAEYFGYQTGQEQYQFIKGAYSKHGILTENMRFALGAGMSGVMRKIVPMPNPVIIPQAPKPDFSLQLDLGGMLFYDGFEIGFAHHEYLMPFVETEAKPKSTTHLHFGISKTVGEFSLFPYFLVSSRQENNRSWQFNVPVQYKWFKAGFAMESDGTSVMLGAQVKRVAVAFYHHRSSSNATSVPYVINEANLTITLANYKKLNLDDRRRALF